MEKYRYKAMNAEGKYVRGRLAAEGQGDLKSLLEGQGMDLISAKVETASSFSFLSTEKLKVKEMITLFNHLGQLDKAGVPLLDALSDVKDSADSVSVRNIIQEVYETVKNGSLFSEALSNHPKTFDKVFVGLVQVGERTGNLHRSFDSIIDHLKWSDDIKRKTVKAVRYPLFSLVVMFGVLWMMTTVVVPKVTGFLQAQSVELPGATRALISFSEFMQNNTLYIVSGIPLLILVYKLFRRFPNFALKSDEIKLYIPPFGGIIQKLDASRFCHFFAITFQSGIGVIDCLSSAEEVINNRSIAKSVEFIKKKVSDGHSLAESIELSGRFPSLVVRMFKVGEESGDMEQAMENIRYFYDQEVNDSIDKIVGMIQPALTLVMGGMMGWITIAVFGPIYSTFSNL